MSDEKVRVGDVFRDLKRPRLLRVTGFTGGTRDRWAVLMPLAGGRSSIPDHVRPSNVIGRAQPALRGVARQTTIKVPDLLKTAYFERVQLGSERESP